MKREWDKVSKKRHYKHPRTFRQIFGSCEVITNYMTDKQINAWWKSIQNQPAPRCAVTTGELAKAMPPEIFQTRQSGLNGMMERMGY